jgi:E3 ubiquitin-protein ligase ZNRF1/2
MGGRQSQEPAPAPMDISPRPTSGTTHRSSSSQHHSSPRHSSSPHSLHHDPPQSSSQDGSPQSRLPTLSNYPHMRPVARTHSQSASSRLQERHSLRTSPRTPAEQFLELNIALSTLQQRLQARAEARESSQSSLHPSSLPAGLPLLFFRPVPTLQCPVCSKDIPSSDMEAHMSQCMSRPRVTYNVDTLAQDSGECSICLDDMVPGEEIVRLPCLCIYHLKCAKKWFKVRQTCPEHPDLA